MQQQAVLFSPLLTNIIWKGKKLPNVSHNHFSDNSFVFNISLCINDAADFLYRIFAQRVYDYGHYLYSFALLLCQVTRILVSEKQYWK